MTPAIVWFRRDLRLDDLPALAAAADAGSGSVVPLFVVDPSLLGPAGPNRRRFLADALRALDRELGGFLVLRRGSPHAVVAHLAAEVGASVVVATADFGPYGTARDRTVAQSLATAGRTLRVVDSPYAVVPGTLRGTSGSPPRVFTAFRRAFVAAGWGARWGVRPCASWAHHATSPLMTSRRAWRRPAVVACPTGGTDCRSPPPNAFRLPAPPRPANGSSGSFQARSPATPRTATARPWPPHLVSRPTCASGAFIRGACSRGWERVPAPTACATSSPGENSSPMSLAPPRLGPPPVAAFRGALALGHRRAGTGPIQGLGDGSDRLSPRRRRHATAPARWVDAQPAANGHGELLGEGPSP